MNHAARSCRHRVGPPWKDEHPAIAPCVKATACQNLGPVYSMISSRLREAQALTPTGPRAELVQHLGRSAGCNAVQCKVGYAHRPELGVKPRCMHKQRSSATRCKSSQNDTKLVPCPRINAVNASLCAAKTQAANAAAKLRDVDEASEAEFPSLCT